MRVDIGIACNKNQDHDWWGRNAPEWLRLAGSGVVSFEGFLAVGSALTDHNRNRIVYHHLDGEGEAIWWIDDDVVVPPGTLERLLALDVPIAAGVYFLGKPPCNPVVYERREDGLYRPLWDYQRGEIIEADSVGMGCTLIRREVYERIQEEYVLFRRERTGTLVPVHRKDVARVRTLAKQVQRHRGEVVVDRHGVGMLMDAVVEAGEVEVWPFYAFENGRTEDHYFCEMARMLGFKVVVDTKIECEHWKLRPITGESFRQMRALYDERVEGDDESA